jgi:hypothetical protein
MSTSFRKLSKGEKNSYVKSGFLGGVHKISFEIKIIDEQLGFF